ncbi:thioesterase [Bacillus sp. Bva_UNVM-123]|uniref:thioesterase family protein n=1 Tax=Bacillus sp. Bva_UNVM-123 TaxID=2829798 RepID=UPI00391FB529
MKPGLKEGQSASIEVTVTSDMFAQFDGSVVHRAYSTVSMIYHMEWASRLIILPFLEDDEEGMGSAVRVKHLSPSSVGSKLTITAILSELKGNNVKTNVTVKNGEKLVGIGEVKQVILLKNKIARLLESDLNN